MEDMDKKEIKEVIEWCDEKGHSEHEILDLIRRIVDAKPRNEEKPDKQALGMQKGRWTCQNRPNCKGKRKEEATDAKNKKRVRPTEIPKPVYK